MTRLRRRRIRSRWLKAWLVAMLALAPVAVLAHGALKSSRPASGAHLVTAPKEVRLDFNEAPELALTRVELVGPGGRAIRLGARALAPDSRRAVIAPIEDSLTAGTYTVRWVFAGRDGHPVRGSFAFTIAPGATGTVATIGAPATPASPATAATPAPPAVHHDPVSMPEGPGFGVGSPAYVVVRWILFVGTIVVIGAVAFRALVLRSMAGRETAAEGRERDAASATIVAMGRRAASLGVGAATVVLVALLLRLAAQSYALHGGAEAWSATMLGGMLARTLWGWGWLAQALGSAAAVLGYARARAGSRAGWIVAAIGALVLAFAAGLSGHAAAAPRLTSLAILANGLHVIGAGGWLGSLLLVVAAGIPVALAAEHATRGRVVSELIRAFSPTALVFVGVLAATGVFAAWLHLGSLAALWESTYGRTLLVKLAIFSGVAATGAYNWLRVRPALGDVEAARRIRGSSTIELAFALAVLLVTAVLVATPPPMEAVAAGVSPM